MIRRFLLTLTAGACFLQGFAQNSYNEQVQDYIARYKDLAILEQQRTGVPASITLAQGIFETAAGSSELCTNASNHFGIKCKNTWTGETYTYTDDAKDECFRKYKTAVVSYQDHSDFLKTNKRYSSLFTLSPTDYAAWAYGLKRCGYATNPQYATKLIKTIEDFKLQEYTYAALNGDPEEVLLASIQEKDIPRSKVSTVMAGEQIPVNDNFTQKAEPATDTDEIIVDKAISRGQTNGSHVTDYYQATSKNGLKGFFARKGDMLLEYAIKNKIRYAKLLEMNDLPDAPMEADMFVYLERKAKTGRSVTHKVQDGETILQISQKEGIQLQQLRAFNHLERGEEPLPGAMLQLQATADRKPALYNNTARTATTGNSTANSTTATRDDGYIAAGGKNNTTIRNDNTTESQEEESATVNDIPATPAKRRVNIADEKPVEETIAEERSRTTTTAAAQKDESKMSALDKLKAHMDKTVYAEREFVPKSSGNYDENTGTADVTETTKPARRNVQPTRQAEEKQKKEQKKEQLKAKSRNKTHTVKRGETLFEIAQKYDLTVTQLQKINKLGGQKKIQPGMKLKVTK